MHQPSGAWMMQVVRNLLDAEDGFLTGKTKLVMNRDPVFTSDVRDPVFTSDVRDLLRSGGVDAVRLPARSANRNAETIDLDAILMMSRAVDSHGGLQQSNMRKLGEESHEKVNAILYLNCQRELVCVPRSSANIWVSE